MSSSFPSQRLTLSISFVGMRRSLRGQLVDKPEFEKQIDVLSEELDVYDQILGKQRYLAGDVSHNSFWLTIRRPGLTIFRPSPS